MKVLLVAEGLHERTGALEALVRRLGLDDAEIEPDCANRKDIHVHRGKGQGFYKRAIRWMLEAQKRKEKFDALILLIDEDGDPSRVPDINKAQEYEGTSLRRALGVAIRSFDAWMLPDEKALTKVLCCPVDRQPDPELIHDPKHQSTELLNRSATQIAQRDMYAAIAAATDLEILETRCPNGFAPFAQRVRNLAALAT